jgi:hypothetical protein
MITLTRSKAFADRLRAYRVEIDGAEVGRIRHGETLQFDLPKGTHRMQLFVDWCDSNPLMFELSEQALHFRCGCRYTGWQLFRGVAHISGLGGTHYLWLEASIREDSMTENTP